jgi:sugar lactone lactonase YvrE
VSGGRFGGDQAISAFGIDQKGDWRLLQEFVDGTDSFTDFKGGNSLALSPNETSLIALASVSDRLFRFRRDPATGKLTFRGSQQVGRFARPGSAGLCFSPDGKFLYVADEASSAIVVYRFSP